MDTSAAGERGAADTGFTAPQISLPKGGGAIRGIGEKFAANPVSGTASLSVPLATSPGRSGFGPQLSLSYDSGAGNGPFGFGWSLALPSITRKTERGLPRYLDSAESDVFILSGTEDLVPVPGPDDTTTAPGHAIRRYRPRIEGLFARIERWSSGDDPHDVHWRSISSDNVLTLYGRDAGSRIADPSDPTRIHSWLICETRDDRGNAVCYEYRGEDGAGVDLTLAHERNRGGRDDARRTANRYLKHVRYGNRRPLLDDAGCRPRRLTDAQIRDAGWMFEVVLDYGEHHPLAPAPGDGGAWSHRQDPFSTYRAGFEVRTCRLCRRVLMFHHFEGEAGVGGACLVRSTDFTYSHERDPGDARNPIHTFLLSVSQNGYRRRDFGYLKRSLPPLEFEYSRPVVQDTLHEVDARSLEGLPVGLDGAAYQWTDLYGEGIPGILTEQGGAWFYKRNLSPISAVARDGVSSTEAWFAPVERVAVRPNLALGTQAQFMDLAGDGQPDLVVLDGPMPGIYEQDDGEWQPFRPFARRLNRDTRDPNLKLVDLDGDGHADVLISENDGFVWHPSLAEAGFGAALREPQALDEEKGPRLVFADGAHSVYLADLSGDGLTDLVRIRNGEVCYWPNLGYGRFGARVTMDGAPWFDHPDQFDQGRIRLADIDGTGTTDLIYLHRDGVRVYFNQSGNGWSPPRLLRVLPHVDELAAIVAADLLGNGTACLVWSSPLPGDARRPLRYVDLMGGQKPHLLVRTVNNLGAETRAEYAPSTRFYLQDRRAGTPWTTRLPFPVHVVERVVTYDHVSRNRFVTRYAYHHGYFDGEEREFRGFGMVEQWDTEQLAAFTGDGALPTATNAGRASHVPPVLTKTWFHTGASPGRDRLSLSFAGSPGTGDPGEYYREPGLTPDDARALLLPDTVLPAGLTLEEERDACRALKGAMLRREVYARDSTAKEGIPYTVAEQNLTLHCVQRRGRNRHAVFFTSPRETLTYHYEREPADPRVQHALTLEVDRYGNVLREVAIGYGRRRPDPSLPLPADRTRQTRMLITCTENRFTNPVDDVAAHPGAYRTPLPAETRTWELTGLVPQNGAARFGFDEWERGGFALAAAVEIPYEQTADDASVQKRPIEHVRTLYRPDHLGADPRTLLPLGALEALALPGESYRLAFTPGLLATVFRRHGEALLAAPAGVLAVDGPGGGAADRGGYVDLDGDGHWWIPSGRAFLSPGGGDTAAQELAHARAHFFLPHRTRDPFHTGAAGTETVVAYDAYDLLMVEARDPLGNRVTVGERLPDGELDPGRPGNDYRVLQPWRVMDPNRNRTQVAFDALGLVVATAVMGRPEESLGDALDGFDPDPPDPAADPHALLGRATTRLVHDLFAYQRTRDQSDPQPAVIHTLARETHDADLAGGQTRIQQSFSYSDGFGREIQKKVQAEPERTGGVAGPPRWVGSGWTIFNNKGKPVRQYEPFFSATHAFEFGVQAGVSPILFYDPAERVVATLHPNRTYEKVVFGPWGQTTCDANDTVAARGTETGDPRTDPDIRGYTAGYFASLPASPAGPWQTWHAEREGGTRGPREQAAATRAAAHADTPTTAHFDTLGRPFLTVARNRVVCPGHTLDDTEARFHTRVKLDIEGNQRAVRDADEQGGDGQGRIVMRYDYDMLGNRVHQASMEAGERWTLSDVAGKPIRAWDGRGHAFRTEYDLLRRPLRSFVIGADPARPGQALLTERLVYGEQHPESELCSLRGKLYLSLDQAGAAATEAHDFKGNALRASRRLAAEYRRAIDWSAADASLPADPAATLDPAALEAALAPLVESDAYTSRTTYDALNRPTTLTTPHTPAMQPSVIRPGYNEANLLERIEASLRGAIAEGRPVWTAFVTSIDYDAKGQRRRIDYGNSTSTFYGYDPDTFRLVSLVSRRNPDAFAGDCPRPPPAGWPGCQAQSLHYTYDPVGNVTHIRDDAQQTVFFTNRRVEPSAEYTYDAIYRLIEATGREHLGQVGGAPVPHSHGDAPRVGIDWSANDGNAMGRYVERYVYDAVGNVREMQHRGSDPLHPGWTRTYAYAETSLIEDGTGGTAPKTSNRLSSTTVAGSLPPLERYVHDAHGNMTRMPHLGGAHPAPNLHWDFRDQLRQTDLGGGGTAYYVYGAAGQRVRKVWEKPGGITEERLYLGGFEIFRRHEGRERLERETLHIMDAKQRIVLVETRTVDTAGGDRAPQRLIRYQFGNHLGSATLELDEDAQIISYEEYTPYGSTSYQATGTPKRYRYTGKERDEESGLYYHGARYYAPWLGRWLAIDPHLEAYFAVSPFAYGISNPIKYHDPDGKDVVIYFQGGIDGAERPINPDPQATAGQTMQEIRDYARTHSIQLDSAVIAPGLTTTDSVDRAEQFIAEHYSEGERIVIYGFSHGGAAAVDLARRLGRRSMEVDALITVDAAYGPLSSVGSVVDRNIPGNVVENFNYYQTSNSGASTSGFSSGSSSSGSGSQRGSSQRGGSSRSDSGSSNIPGSRGYPNRAESAATIIHNQDMSGRNVGHDNIDEVVQREVTRRITDRLSSPYHAVITPGSIRIPEILSRRAPDCAGLSCHTPVTRGERARQSALHRFELRSDPVSRRLLEEWIQAAQQQPQPLQAPR